MGSVNESHLAARAYAEQHGWSVFPVWPRSKSPAVPSPGYKLATTDTAQIDKWFSRTPFNIGIAVGESGLCVIDIDPRNQGHVFFEQFCEQYGKPPDTPCVATGGGGWHWYFRAPPAGVHLGTIYGNDKQDGFEIKSGESCGYVLAPPSIHPNGPVYEWEPSLTLGEVPLAPLPDAWIAALRVGAKPASREWDNAASVVDAPIFALCAEMGLRPVPMKCGWKASVICPWEHEHSQRNGSRVGGLPTTSTALFAAQSPWEWGGFHCTHAHCVGRTYKHVVASATYEMERRHRPRYR